MSAATLSVPLLREGDHLSRDEFERRYEAMPDVKAELLDGVVYMSSPVSIDHGVPTNLLGGWLLHYEASTRGVQSASNVTVRLADRDEPQPDVFLRILEEFGGASFVDDDRYLSGVPDLLGEVSRSTADYDRKVKMLAYLRAGIREVILWRVDDEAIDWHVLRDGAYELLPVGPDGMIRSETFPGLWLDVAAMVDRDADAILKALQRGVDSTEHTAFVAWLEKARHKKS